MSTKLEKFSALHQPGQPLVLYNIWDVGSAKAVAAAGAAAIATGSWALADAFGYSDGQKMPLSACLENVARIVQMVDLPVSFDFEAGYGVTASEVALNALAVAKTGVVGVNVEDQKIGGEGLYSIDEQVERIKAVVASGLFVNARTDLFIKTPPDQHNVDLVQSALARANAYAQAGANAFFVPFLKDADLIERLCKASPLPVNVMMTAGMLDNAQMAARRVARISYGPGPYRAAMAWLQQQARSAFEATVSK
jgi:2-methylisocitrate lyase-like PEP mutase family enzyme